MKKISHKKHAALNLPSLRLEGVLFLPDQLEKAALGVLGDALGQGEADYHTPKGLSLKDDYSRAFQIASAQWKHFAPLIERTDRAPLAVTNNFVQELLRDAFGYHTIQPIDGFSRNERHFPISFLAGAVPVVVAPHHLGLDSADECFAISHVDGGGSRKKTAFQLAQEWLNASEEHFWALVTNGKQLRLLRDAETLTRPSYLEIDLQDILSGQRFAEFAIAWRLLHASRSNQSGEQPQHCIWEAWREAGKEEGTRVREGLRKGVTQALITLGTGFLQHPSNSALRQQLQEGSLSKYDYFQQLLRLIYRLIFLFTVEERGVLHPDDDSPQAQQARRAFAEGYAMARLRERALKRRARNDFDDLWQAACILFRGLHQGEPRLALPALGGLFAQDQCPELDSASLTNADFLQAILHLRWDNASGSLALVDYRNMGPEELGSVYESLLELVPEVELPGRQFGFAGLTSEGSTQGNARKTSGSYYTPDSLVQELIKTALEPVIEQRLADNPTDPSAALLDIKVIDPSCGSGHFLLAAARRLAEELAVLRSPEGAVKPQDYRHALREVISQCIFGVDRNPMALELCRTALWLEGFEEGRPLSFLDHHLQCGDALLGLTDLGALKIGIPAAAFKPLSGDDNASCKELAKSNKVGLKQLERDLKHGQQLMRFDTAQGLTQLQALEALPEDTSADIAARATAYQAFERQAFNSRIAQAADLLVGAFVLPKTEATANLIPTSQTLYLHLFSEQPNAQHQQQLEAAREACREARVFHWPLAFPQVFTKGGFDCVLGNPPWERIKLQEEEFFASRSPLVAQAKNKAERSQRIDWLAQGKLARQLYPGQETDSAACVAEQRLYREFLRARRTAEAASVFAHVKGSEGGRYPLTGVGDVNTYALFAETIHQITSARGRAGFIVPSGLATDNSTRAFFGELIFKKSLDSFFEFENEGFFPGAGQGHMLRFALTTIVGADQNIPETRFLFQAKKLEHLHDPERVFTLSAEDIERVNPNTLTCPIFQSRYDAELTKKIYQRVPVMIREAREGQPGQNPWGIRFMAMFHMSNDSHLFKTYKDLIRDGFELEGNEFIQGMERFVPLYESKMIQLYNHRNGDFADSNHERAHILPLVPEDRLANRDYLTMPYYWVSSNDVDNALKEIGWSRKWFLAWRNVTDSRASARTLVTTAIPFCGVGNSLPVYLPLAAEPKACALLLANMSSLVVDYAARNKVGGLNFNYFIFKQMPVLAPDYYTKKDFEYIIPRVAKLCCSSVDMAEFAKDLDCKVSETDSISKDKIQAELDAYYAKLYGLNRNELEFILEPESIKPGYPSETFSVLKRNEEREFGEYRTRRLVLEAWDKLESGQLSTTNVSNIIAANESPLLDTTILPDLAWQRPGVDQRAETGVQLLALLKIANRPLPAGQVRLAAVLTMEPRLLFSMLDQQQNAEWQRLIGNEAIPLSTNILTFASRSNHAWGAAVRNLRTNDYLVEDQQNRTWASGARIHEFAVPEWAHGRANWVLGLMRTMDTDFILSRLPEAAKEWINAAA
ncbi:MULTISPECIES: N-6 DNA methylase [unclassified Halomonas]|uniref:Eco57I restriction-modification methylase domain-containing protein n=1 Tax=unclassified Halomonas TaxID=2609666 RepID=UPI0007DA4731|nr:MULTISPECIES: N-6 DNA methylase [unclassified Halomonas]MBT2788020.1 N-6 DNA methylase [Halomonas sp. ISL-106]MBT2795769.1 N-6 DNA methylase [Halomonas sp. ISL-104]OAL61062.1 restriction endonuclease [Halomonas sp. ALS9]